MNRGDQILIKLEQFLERFVAFPTIDARVAAVLWTAHSHAVKAFESTPRLALLSPEPGSGKTRTLELLDLLTPAPMHVLSASTAAIFRSIDNIPPPTLLFDEVDTIFGKHGKGDDNEDLRGLLNAGHRNGAAIPRCTGPTHTVTMFPVYAAVALAGLGDLPDTLMTRSVVIRMRRRRPNEVVEPFRYRVHAPAGHELRDELAMWATEMFTRLTESWPKMPPGIEDRPADVWEPLLAVADAAGGDWAQRARAACLALAGQAIGREASLGIRLLTDLKMVFANKITMSTADILNHLHAIEESPWANLKGQPLNANGLAYRLNQYEVASKKVKIDGKSLQGYRAEDLWDAWERYCPSPRQETEPAEPPEPRRSEPSDQVPFDFEVVEPVEPLVPLVPDREPEPEPDSPPSSREVPPVPEVPAFQPEEPDWHADDHRYSLEALVREAS